MEGIIDAPLDLTDYAVQLKAAGVSTAIRYYNNQNSTTFPSKCLTRAEFTALTAAGISLATVFQQRGGANGNLDDLSTANGRRDGQRALTLARGVRQPQQTAIYFAVDWDYFRQSELTQIASYFRAAKTALGGSYKLGVYGSGTVAAMLTAKGLIDYIWLAGATGWSGTRTELEAGRWHLFQKHLHKTSAIGGFGYDGNIVNPANGDFGQFTSGAPVTTPRGDGAVVVYEVSARSGLNLRGGPGESYNVLRSIPKGTLVTGIMREGDWIQVDLEGDGVADGYMFGQYLEPVSGGLPLPLPDDGTGHPAPAAPRPVDIARQELAIGVSEIAGSQNNPRIVMYHATTEGGASADEVAWCSSFVNYCVERTGLEGTDSKAARSWHNSGWGEMVTQPQDGDIVVFSRTGGGAHAGAGHVGFYVSQTTTTVKVLGGNQGNRISIRDFPKNGPLGSFNYRVLSYRRP
jgi:uncharacterized protein (TIGR02594 family)